jgi:hypothetical protein
MKGTVMRHLSLAFVLLALLAAPNVSAASNPARAVNLHLRDFASGFRESASQLFGVSPSDTAKYGILAHDAQSFQLVANGLPIRVDSYVMYSYSTTQVTAAWTQVLASRLPANAQHLPACSSGTQCNAISLNVTVKNDVFAIIMVAFYRGRYLVEIYGSGLKGVMTPTVVERLADIVDTRIQHAH